MKAAFFHLSLFTTLSIAVPRPQAPASASAAAAGNTNPLLPAPLPANPLFPAPPPANPPANGQPCTDDVNTLAAGIQRNLDLSGGEMGTTQAMLQILLQSGLPDADPMRFDPEKMTLAGFVGQDMDQMRKNIAALPQGNPSQTGLQMVLKASGDAMSLVQGMSGNKERDGPSLAKLSDTWVNNMKQNMQNILDATQGCLPQDQAAAKSIQAAQLMGLKAVQPNNDGLFGGLIGILTNQLMATPS